MTDTLRSNCQKGSKSSHILSAWSRKDGVCHGQRAVEEKNNEITAIPELLDKIPIKGQIVTIDAMGIKPPLRRKSVKKGGLCAGLKENQGTLYEEVSTYLDEEEISWLSKKKEWKGLKSIGVVEKTIQIDQEVKKEYRYYIRAA